MLFGYQKCIVNAMDNDKRQSFYHSPSVKTFFDFFSQQNAYIERKIRVHQTEEKSGM